MLSKPIPAWILVGGALLASMAGCVNAVGFLSFRHQALSHLSGTVSNLGIGLAQGDRDLVLQAAAAIAAFFLGCVLSGLIVHQSALRVSQHYATALAVEAVALGTAAYLLGHGLPAGGYFAALGCGLQNGMATNYSGAVIRTTHVTGMITDLGVALGQMARGQRPERRRLGLYGLLLAAFLLGGVGGALGFARWGDDVLWIPAVLAGAAGIGYAAFICPRSEPRGRA